MRKFNCLRLEGSMGQFEAEDRGYISDEHFSGWLTIFVVDGLTYEVRTAKSNDTHLDNLDGGAERWGVECAFMRERRNSILLRARQLRYRLRNQWHNHLLDHQRSEDAR